MALVRVTPDIKTEGASFARLAATTDGGFVTAYYYGGDYVTRYDATGGTVFQVVGGLGGTAEGGLLALTDGRFATYRQNGEFGGAVASIVNADGSIAIPLRNLGEGRDIRAPVFAAAANGAIFAAYDDRTESNNSFTITFPPMGDFQFTSSTLGEGSDVTYRFLDGNLSSGPLLRSTTAVETVNGGTVSRLAGYQAPSSAVALRDGSIVEVYYDQRFVGIPVERGGGADYQYVWSGQVRRADGTLGPVFQINTDPLSNQNSSVTNAGGASVIALPNGGFAVLWHEYRQSNAGIRSYDTEIRYFNAEGVATSGEITVLQRSADVDPYAPAKAMADGSIVMGFNAGVSGVNGNGSSTAFLEVIGPNGSGLQTFQLTPTAANTEKSGVSDVAVLADGTVEVALVDGTASAGDAKGISVLRHYALTAGAGVVFTGTAAADTPTLSEAADYAYGGGGNDTLNGLGGADALYGQDGADILSGGSGNDLLVGGAGADRLTGGIGADIFRYAALSESVSSSFDTITDFQHGTDVIDVAGISGGLVGLYHDDYGNTGVAYGYANGAFGGVVLTLGDVEANDLRTAAGAQFYIVGGATADVLIGGGGIDTIQGGGGNDVLAGGGGADLLAGGAGVDVYSYGALSDSTSAAFDTIFDFQSGTDFLNLTTVSGAFLNLVHDGAGHTGIFYGFSGAGAGGAIYAYGDVQGYDIATLPGAAFYLSGSGASELLVGGAAADTIVGAGGQDTLYGGAGADVFLYQQVSDSTSSAPDYIADFQHGSDKIDLAAVAGGFVNIVHPGSGATFLYFAPTSSGAAGTIGITGDVETSDLILAPGTTVVVTGSFSGPEPAETEAWQPPHASHWTSSYGLHASLF